MGNKESNNLSESEQIDSLSKQSMSYFLEKAKDIVLSSIKTRFLI